MNIKVSPWKPEVNENATLSTVNIAINDNHRLWPYNLRMQIFWLVQFNLIFSDFLNFEEISRKMKFKT